MRSATFVISAAAAIAGLAASPAGAKRQVDPKLSAALACTSVTENDARLRCFDQAVAGLQQALAAGTLNTGTSGETEPVAMGGVVQSAVESGFNRHRVTLDSGDRYELEVGTFDRLPRRGAKVTVTRAKLTGFWFKEENADRRRATYLGRRTN